MHEPTITTRREQPYAGIRAVLRMSDFGREIPAMLKTVLDSLVANRMKPSGKPFLRYHVVDMPARMDVETGIPLEEVADTSGDAVCGILPAGRYATLTFTGTKHGVEANRRLLEWIAEQNENVEGQKSDRGEAFVARYETYLTDMNAEPDEDKWQIEVAIKLRD